MIKNIGNTSSALLLWYDNHQRDLPWRRHQNNPYYIWLSEIMLQQTTVVTVAPYFNKFIEIWPTIEQLAECPLDDVLIQWAGLGYYARARNLHKCAGVITSNFKGAFPDTMAELLNLPGIGPYTAAAICAIAFQKSETVMDGNVERVISRLFKYDGQLPSAKAKFYALAQRQTPQERAGDYAQAMMDLGATICTPKAPKCTICPLKNSCNGKDIAETLPRKAPKAIKPKRYGWAFFITNDQNQILLRKRPEKGLLGKMAEIPGTKWLTGETLPLDDALKYSPVTLNCWQELAGNIRHTFTHFHLELSVITANITEQVDIGDCYWQSLENLDDEALPTLMQKAIKHALQAKLVKRH